MDARASEYMRQAVTEARRVAEELDLAERDRADLLATVDRIELELSAPRPNERTLAICLNSLARSLSTEPRALPVCRELDSALRRARLPANWSD